MSMRKNIAKSCFQHTRPSFCEIFACGDAAPESAEWSSLMIDFSRSTWKELLGYETPLCQQWNLFHKENPMNISFHKFHFGDVYDQNVKGYKWMSLTPLQSASRSSHKVVSDWVNVIQNIFTIFTYVSICPYCVYGIANFMSFCTYMILIMVFTDTSSWEVVD